MERRKLVPPSERATVMQAIRIGPAAAEIQGDGRKKLVDGATGRKTRSHLTMTAVGAGWTSSTQQVGAVMPSANVELNGRLVAASQPQTSASDTTTPSVTSSTTARDWLDTLNTQ